MGLDVARKQLPGMKALAAVRPSMDVLANLAACYFTVGEPEIAAPLAKQSWDMDKDTMGTGLNYAMVLKDLGRHVESLQAIQEVYCNHPDDKYVQLAYGEALLKAGFWSQAWPIYDNARPTQRGAANHLTLPMNVIEWQDEILGPDDDLLVINEGGVGDRLNYPRWLAELTKRNINWKYFCYPELQSIYERVIPRERLVIEGNEINPKYWTTVFALPARLNASPTRIPPPLKYTPKPEMVERFKITRADKYPIVGICWRAAELFQGDRKVRSMGDGEMMRLVTATAHRVHYVNLQYQTRAPYPILTTNAETWEEYIGLISNLDAVISVDTGMAHLAGSMGKPLALVLSSNGCWKWGRENARFKWYPEARYYSNEGHGFGFDFSIDSLVGDVRDGKWPVQCAS